MEWSVLPAVDGYVDPRDEHMDQGRASTDHNNQLYIDCYIVALGGVGRQRRVGSDWTIIGTRYVRGHRSGVIIGTPPPRTR